MVTPGHENVIRDMQKLSHLASCGTCRHGKMKSQTKVLCFLERGRRRVEHRCACHEFKDGSQAEFMLDVLRGPFVAICRMKRGLL
jgi:hypothetical protein